jgi:hypothetical protein
LSPEGIFLSYRREDAAYAARLLKLKFKERFPHTRIFMDVDSIEPGLDFAEVIRDAVNSCALLVALIGPEWATVTDEKGARRLDNPDDYVRFEVQAALERGVRVIPVLIDGARPLRKQQLPDQLQKLARLHAQELSHGRHEYDADQLVGVIERVLAAGPGELVQPDAEQAVHQGEEARQRESFWRAHSAAWPPSNVPVPPPPVTTTTTGTRAAPPGPPQIAFTSVPPIGSTDNLAGRVSNIIDPDLYRVAVFIEVNGVWWIKPYRARPLTEILPDGTWTCNIVTGGHDQDATAIRAFVLHADINLPTQPSPSYVEPHAVASVSKRR